jgi:hypothetical protein
MSDIYRKLLQDVEDKLNNHPYGDIAIGQVHLMLYGLQSEPDKIKYLRKVLKNHEGTTQRLGERTEEAVKEFQRHTEDMGYGDGEGTELH